MPCRSCRQRVRLAAGGGWVCGVCVGVCGVGGWECVGGGLSCPEVGRPARGRCWWSSAIPATPTCCAHLSAWSQVLAALGPRPGAPRSSPGPGAIWSRPPPPQPAPPALPADGGPLRRFVTRSSSFTKEDFDKLLQHTGMFNGGLGAHQDHSASPPPAAPQLGSYLLRGGMPLALDTACRALRQAGVSSAALG